MLLSLSFPFLARAEDPQPPPRVHRLDYVHYDTVQHSVEWGVSEGTIAESGDFAPSHGGSATYSINLETGVMTHDGEDGVLSPGETYDAFRVFRALSNMIAIYTENWNADGVSGSEDSGREISVAKISQKPGAQARPSGRHRPYHAARSARASRAMATGALTPQASGVIRAPLTLH